ncbi:MULTISPECIES: hypothetical protein [Vibrio]|uniref:hypothetical protein n=1 Tax=Vibrio TaxID=662 RepID=UPI001F2405E8|nr:MULTISPECIES: hypothetical protein [Vibrio]USD62986.1 hypothetical protein J4N45_26950 [Vibrio sp. SCSIO 43140]
MEKSEKERVKELLIATKYGVSASEMPIIIQVPQERGLAIIKQLIAEGEDVHALGEGENPEELVLYSIGSIDDSIAQYE